MASTGGKKGKKAKWLAVSLTDIIAEPTSTISVGKSWADDVEEEAEYGAYSSRRNAAPVVLPSVSRAARGGLGADDDSVPRHPPFVAYVSNLPYEVDEQAISELFEGLKIANLRLPREGDRLKGFGYVEFEDRQSLIDAMNIADLTISGRRIRIDVSTQETDKRMGNSRMGGRNDREREYDPERTTGDWRSGPRADPPSSESRPRNREMGRDMGRDRERDSSPGESKPGAWRDSERPRDEPSRPAYGGRDSYGRDRERGFGGGRDGDRPFNREGNDRERGFNRDADRDRGFNRDGDRDRGFNRDGDRDRGYGGDRDRGFNRDGDRGADTKGWRDADRDATPRGGFREAEDRGGSRGFGERRAGPGSSSGYGERERDAPPANDAAPSEPRQRPKLNLLPRSAPRDDAPPSESSADTAATGGDDSASPPKPAPAENVFGAAKPVDTAAKEREIEERLLKKEEESRKARDNKDRGGAWKARRNDNSSENRGPRRNDERSDADVSDDRDRSGRDGARESRPLDRDGRDGGRDRPTGGRDGQSGGRDARSGGREARSGGRDAPKERDNRDRDEDRPLPTMKEQDVPNFAASNKFSFLEDAEGDNSE